VTPVELLLSKLPNAKRHGEAWAARCPAHKDKRPSLSISEGEGGRALVHCHAGCKPEEVVAALGMTLADLMPATPTTGRPMPRGMRKPMLKNSAGPATFATAADAVAELERHHGPRAAAWTYRNAGGEPVGLVVRWNLANGKKDIRPVSKTQEGWIIGGMTEPRPLYRLPELLTKPGDRVFVCEGEKATDAAAGLGYLATTSPHGCKSAGKADWTPLAGREVVILPDNDGGGEKYAVDVVGILAKLTPPARVRLVRLCDTWPDLPEGGDIADVVDRGEAPDTIKAKLGALVDAAEPEAPVKRPPAVEPFRPFPTDALPEPARSFVRTCARAIGCDESFIALPLLAALASAIGNTRRVQLKRGWSEPAIVWVAVVGDSGTLKSPALEVALRAIRKRQHTAIKRHAEAMEKFQTEVLQWEKDIAAWKRSKTGGDPPAKPEEPKADRCWCDDVTVEALAVLLLNQWRGLLLVRDELSGWLGGFDRYTQGKGGDVAKWLEMFGGRSMVVDRKTGFPRTIYVPRAAVSVCGGIQPGTLARALGNEHRENGLAARLLLACPPRRPKRWTEADISPDLERSIAAVFERLYGLQPATDDDGDAQPVIVPLSADGKAAWVDFYNAHGQEQADLAGDLSAAWSKLEGYAARLALVVHFVRWAAGDSTLTSADEVDADSIAAGVKLSRWFGNEARRAYAILSESDEERDGRRLAELIQRKGGTVTVRELQQTSRLFRTASEAGSALDALAEAGGGRWEQQGPGARGGRPTRIFRLNAPAPSTQPPETAPLTPTKPPVVMPEERFVDVGAVDNPEAEGEEWGEV
jgi:hypothetical protein